MMQPSWLERAQLDANVARINRDVGTDTVMPWLAVEQFEYERRRNHSAALQLLATVHPELGIPADSRLFVEKDAFRHAYAPSASTIAPPRASARLIDSPSALLWRVEFTVSLEVVEYPHALFSLIADDRAPIALPAPYPLSADASRVRVSRARVRRHFVALAAGFAVATASGSPVALASAATVQRAAPHKTAMIKPVTQRAPKLKHPTSRPTSNAHRGSNGKRNPSNAGTHPQTSVTTTTATGVTPPAQCDPNTVAVSSPNQGSPMPDNPLLQPAAPAVAGEPQNCQPTSPAHHQAPGKNSHRHHHKRHRHQPDVAHQHSSHPNASGNHHKGTHHKGTHHRVSGGAPVPPTTTPTPPAAAPVDSGTVTTTATSVGSGGFNLDPAALAALSQASSQLATDSQPPAFLMPIYKAAEARYHVPWEILAAINWIETDYGANLNISSAGAMGWMQFMPGTWQEYGVAADGSGQPNPYNPQDAIFAAARYLAANGAAQNLPKAIYAYNHATWYVVEVMQRAQIISEHAPAGANAPASMAASLAAGFNLDPVTIAVLSHASSPLANGNQPAAFLIPIYQAAAARYHVPWQILAAINWMDTNHAGNRNTSSAGAMRWMQFTPGSWRQYGVAADGYSRPNPHSLPDAIFSAAHYLAANGAAHNLPEAIYAYNQGTWYTVDVMRRAKIIGDHAHASADRSLLATGQAGLAGTGHPGLAGAVKMLLAAYSAVGGPYSQANHDSFGQTAADLRRAGTDCSGFVSWVLDQVYPGFGNQTTVTLPGQPGVQFGVGHWVTMWDRPLPGNAGHVIINILGTWFESGGNTTYNPAGGIAPMSEAQAVGELAGGFLPFHLQGL
jgi:membrane-bound lytic murein transglycosylase B